jgi:hypothetical protein
MEPWSFQVKCNKNKKANQSHYRPEVSRGFQKLKFPDYVTMAQYGGKVVNLTHRPFLPPGNVSGTHLR